MAPEALLYGALLAVAVLYLLAALAQVGQWLWTDASGDEATADETVTDRARRDTPSSCDTVTCTDCGAANEPGYRFCRECVSELPGGVAPQSTPAGPRQRRSL